MNLILLEDRDALDAGRVTLTDGRAEHLTRVLRVTPGQTVRVGLLDGPLGTGTVERIDGESVTLQCAFENTAPARPPIDLLLAVPRPKVMRRLWAPLASLGVGRIVLTNAERVERPYFDSHVLEEATYRPLLVEGLQQARDTQLPDVSIHRRFKVLVEDHLDALCGDSLRVVADPGASASLTTTIVSARPQRILMAVGPEGGWNSYELSLLDAHGFRAVGLGSRTLRVDTACTALIAIAAAALHDLNSQA
jgi:RsmE family RNA methyltransferase